ncbi:MAG: DoxX family protein [Nitrospinaceae bacterium]
MKALFQTDTTWHNLILRMTLGIVIFPHGAQKLMGWFGGNGFSATMGFFTEKMGLPVGLAFLIIFCEAFGSLSLITGLLTRVSAFGLICLMSGAIFMVHWKNGFFMNWFGQQPGEGFEYHLLVIGICLTLILAGAGKWSLDRIIASWLSGRNPAP